MLVFFCTGIILIPLGLGLDQIRIPLTREEISDIMKDPKKTEWCKDTTISECPLGPFPSKLPYEGIGQTIYYIGTASLVLGSIISIQKNAYISRRFVPNWIFFVGTIMTSILLAVLPIRIPTISSEPFCIDPLCPLGPYFTVDPSIFEPLLYLGIMIAIIGAITCFIKLYK